MDCTEYTFVFADLAGYTALTEAHGDEGAATVATRFHELTRAALGDAQLVKTLGDGVMIVAPDLASALRVAERLSREVTAESDFPAVRVGLHRGAAARRDDDYFGNAVNLTSRVMESARPGQVLCTEQVAEQATADQLARTLPLGTVHLKNIVEPVALYELRFEGPAAPFKHVDPVCRMLVDDTNTRAIVEYQGTPLYFCSAGCAERFERSPDSYLSVVSGSSPPPAPT